MGSTSSSLILERATESAAVCSRYIPGHTVFRLSNSRALLTCSDYGIYRVDAVERVMGSGGLELSMS
jgi:hypothetical protein